MKIKTFNLLDKIQCEGLEAGQWNIYMFLESVSTDEFFGTTDNKVLEPGIYITVYESENDTFPFSGIVPPDFSMECGEKQKLLFYNMSE